MKKFRKIYLLVLLLFYTTLLSGFKLSIDSSQKALINNYRSDVIIVKFKPNYSVNYSINHNNIVLTGYSDIDSLNIKYKCSDIKKLFPRENEKTNIYEELNLGGIYIFRFELNSNLDCLLNDYFLTSKFEYVEPDFIGKENGQRLIPNDQYFFRQWGLKNDGTFPSSHPGIVDADIDMDEAWEVEQGDSTIILAVLDSGCRLTHPELAGRIWINTGEIPGNSIDDDGNGYIDDYQGWDFAYNDNNPNDGTGHGTNVTGIVGGNGNNSIGYAGVDWNCKLMICKILNNSGFGYYSWWEEGIYYAVNNGAKLINMSVGGTSFSSSLQDAVNYAYLNDVFIACSMGNYNSSTPNYPAAYSNTIAVGATDTDDTRCNPFSWGGGSNYGLHIDVVAPGNYIYGLYYLSNTNYDWYWSGTSQATPYVTGLACLLLAQDTTRTVDQIRNIIRNTAEDQVGNPYEDTPGWDQYYGYGRINANDALNYASVEDENQLNSTSLILAQNYPNPFNSKTYINYYLPKSTNVKLQIYNIKGQLIKTLVVGYKHSGNNTVIWNAKDLNSGIYFYMIKAGKLSDKKRCIILR